MFFTHRSRSIIVGRCFIWAGVVYSVLFDCYTYCHVRNWIHARDVIINVVLASTTFNHVWCCVIVVRLLFRLVYFYMFYIFDTLLVCMSFFQTLFTHRSRWTEVGFGSDGLGCYSCWFNLYMCSHVRHSFYLHKYLLNVV